TMYDRMSMPRVGEKAGFQISKRLIAGGDQPRAIAQLTEGVLSEMKFQTLLGATGTGKTFTIAHVIQAVQRPTLVIAHNKTLTAQLCNEFHELFPENAVHYFVSYYDYYQPEAYLPQTEVEDQIREKLLSKIEADTWEAWFSEAREEAKIGILF
ncbi:unnamed protein product, partial [marine sediment metagenome]